MFYTCCRVSTWMNWMVRALFPTPPPPTTTSLNLSSSPLIFSSSVRTKDSPSAQQPQDLTGALDPGLAVSLLTVMRHQHGRFSKLWCANDGLRATPVNQSPDGVPLSTHQNNTHRRGFALSSALKRDCSNRRLLFFSSFGSFLVGLQSASGRNCFLFSLSSRNYSSNYITLMS